MTQPIPNYLLDRDGLDLLMAEILDDGYQLIGPIVRDGAIRYGLVESSRDLPAGRQDVQERGTYRLRHRDDDAFFGFAAGQDSLKSYFFPSTLQLWRGRKNETGWEVWDEEQAGN